jgi:hypothetical protein
MLLFKNKNALKEQILTTKVLDIYFDNHFHLYIFSSTYFEKLLTKSILALHDHKSIEPLKMMVEQEQESKSEFLHVVRRYVYRLRLLLITLSNIQK